MLNEIIYIHNTSNTELLELKTDCAIATALQNIVRKRKIRLDCADKTESVGTILILKTLERRNRYFPKKRIIWEVIHFFQRASCKAFNCRVTTPIPLLIFKRSRTTHNIMFCHWYERTNCVYPFPTDAEEYRCLLSETQRNC